MKKSFRSLGFAAAFLFVLAVNGCGSVSIRSQWLPGPAVADTHAIDWSFSPSSEEDDLSFQASNDDHFLYLHFSSTSPDIKRQLAGAFRQSVSVWFDPRDQKETPEGVRLEVIPDHSVGYPQLGNAESDYIATAMHIVSIEEPGRAGYPRILEAPSKEVDVALEAVRGRMSLDIKIPLQSGDEHPFALGVLPGQKFSMEVVSSPIDPNAAQEELDLERQDRESQQSSSGGGSGVPSTGRHHHGGGRSQIVRVGAPSPFDVWAELKLAKP